MDHVVTGRTARIEDMAPLMEAAFNASDAAALASLYDDTAILMPPNEPLVRGRAEIQAWFERAPSPVARMQTPHRRQENLAPRRRQVRAASEEARGRLEDSIRHLESRSAGRLTSGVTSWLLTSPHVGLR
jgi:glutathione S-transferase